MTINIKVIAEDGTEKESKINIERSTSKSNSVKQKNNNVSTVTKVNAKSNNNETYNNSANNNSNNNLNNSNSNDSSNSNSNNSNKNNSKNNSNNNLNNNLDNNISNNNSCSHSWEAATCNSPKKCKKCGKTEGGALEHDYSNATCTEAAKCKRCGNTKGNALNHTGGKATCTAAAVCSRCGKSYGNKDGNNHSGTKNMSGCTYYKWSCCGASGGYSEHTGGKATCTAAAVCSRCQRSYGNKNGNNHTGTKNTSGCTYYRWSCCGASGGYSEHTGGKATCTAAAVCSRCQRSYGNKNSSNHTGRKNTSGCTYYEWSCCGASGGIKGHNYPYKCSNCGKNYGTCSRCSGSTISHNPYSCRKPEVK